MSLSTIERAFLEKLAGFKSGRCGWPLETYENALLQFGGLIREGYARERRYDFSPGFQILPKGRAYLEGNPE